MAKRQITMNEEKLRNFISYSVARLLKEGYGYGRDIYDTNGEYDGSEDSNYGPGTMVIEPEIDGYLDELGSNDEGDAVYEALNSLGMWPIKVKVDFDGKQGMKGDGYLQPPAPDEYWVKGWEIVDIEKIQDQQLKALVQQMVERYMDEQFDIDGELDRQGMLDEENRGVMAHFSGGEFLPESPYKDMTYDQYLQVKADEREKEKRQAELHKLNYPEEDEKSNLGITTHFDGKHDEDEPDRFHLTHDELHEMIQKTIKELLH